MAQTLYFIGPRSCVLVGRAVQWLSSLCPASAGYVPLRCFPALSVSVSHLWEVTVVPALVLPGGSPERCPWSCPGHRLWFPSSVEPGILALRVSEHAQAVEWILICNL